MGRMYNLVELLSSNTDLNNSEIKSHISQLDVFRFDSNNILNTLGELMSCAADGEFKSSEVTFRDLGVLLSMLTELNTLCDEQEQYYRKIAKQGSAT